MKRSKAVQLLLISATPFYLTACDPHQYTVKTVSESKDYKDLQDCLDDKQNPLVCSKAYTAVKQIEQKNPLTYKSQADCQQDFDQDLCAVQTGGTANSHGFYARSSGFRLSSTRDVVVDKQGNRVDPVTNDYARSVAQKESHYVAQPLYKPREGRSPTNLSASTEGSGITTSHTSSGSHFVSGGVAGYVANQFASNKDNRFAFTQAEQNKPTVKRYIGSHSSGHSSSTTYRSGFSRSYSHGSFGG